jgi:hypothetical protein
MLQYKILDRQIKICLIESYSKVYVGKYLPDTFHIEDSVKQRDALAPVLSSAAL